MENLYMESGELKVVKVFDEFIDALNNYVEVDIPEWLKLKVDDTVEFRTPINNLDDLEIKINDDKFKKFPLPEKFFGHYIECYKFQILFEYLLDNAVAEDLQNNDKIEDVIHFNEDQIFEYNGDRMGFVLTKYASNNSPGISIVYVKSDNTDDYLYGNLSINLEEYDIVNDAHKIAIHHDYMEEPQSKIVDKFREMYCKDYNFVSYGFAASIVVELEDIRKIPISPGLLYEEFEDDL